MLGGMKVKFAKCINDVCNILNKDICCCDCLNTDRCEFVCPAYKFDECEQRFYEEITNE